MNESIEALIEKAHRFLRPAEILRAAGGYDSAASRLYYAMLYCAQAALLSRGLTFKSHRSVLAAFGRHFAKTGELSVEMHRWLLDAFDKRQLGDYVPVPSLEVADVEDLQPKAAAFVERIEAWLREKGAM
ncbi:MAG: HEPN domain-containing protein [Chloroflexi bacterium]|nr:HEPN domain-containing protein [Chloroflexota bacterium]